MADRAAAVLAHLAADEADLLALACRLYSDCRVFRDFSVALMGDLHESRKREARLRDQLDRAHGVIAEYIESRAVRRGNAA